MTTQRYLRKIYNYKGKGKYLSVLFPVEMADAFSEYVYVERVEDCIIIRPCLIIPK